MMVADLAEHRQKLGRRHAIASFSLNRLDENRGHFVGRSDGGEQFLDFAASAIVRQMMSAGHHRAEAAHVNSLRGPERHGAVGSAVKRPEERDYARPPRVMA